MAKIDMTNEEIFVLLQSEHQFLLHHSAEQGYGGHWFVLINFLSYASSLEQVQWISQFFSIILHPREDLIFRLFMDEKFHFEHILNRRNLRNLSHVASHATHIFTTKDSDISLFTPTSA